MAKRSLLVFETVLIIAASAWFCLYDIGGNSFGFGDQTIHAKVTQEMVQKGHYLTPTFNGESYNHKPPLKMWLSSFVVRALGESTFSYRVLDGVIGTVFLTTFWLFCRSFTGSRLVAWLSFFALLGCRQLFFGHGLREATQDALLNLLLLGAIWSAWHWFNSAQQKAIYLLGSAFLIGLGILTKSAGALIIGPIFFVYLLLNRKNAFQLMHRWSLFLWSLLAVLILPLTYGLVRYWYEPSFLQVMFGHEVLQRATEGFHHRHEYLFYLQELFLGNSAVSPWLLGYSLLWAGYRMWKSPDRKLCFLLCWAVIPVILYSCMASRLPWYIQPAFPAFALLVGLSLQPLFKRAGQFFQGAGQGSLLATVFAFVAAVLLGQNILAVGQKIVKEKNVNPLELIVQQLQKSSTLGTVASIALPEKLGLEEYFYWDMVGIQSYPIEQVEAVTNKSDLKALVTTREYFVPISSKRAPNCYISRAPNVQRRKRIIIMLYDQQACQALGSTLSQTQRSFRLADQLSENLLGFLHPENIANEVGRVIQGSVAAHPLPTDVGDREFGSILEYDVALIASPKPVQLTVYLQDKLLQTFKVESVAKQRIKLSIPKEYFGVGTHTVTFRLQEVTGPPVSGEERRLVVYEGFKEVNFTSERHKP